MYFPLLSLSFILGFVAALPSPDPTPVTVPTVLASPTSITTTQTVQTADGTMIETCVLTFSQVGQQIQEVQNCTLAMGSSQFATTLITAPPTASAMAAAAFVLPGTILQVFPVGLGIYGGITSIAVFAVVFVTWERVLHRKAFRQARMIENNTIRFGGLAKGN